MGCNLSPANFPVREKRNCFLQSNNITLCVAMILHRQPNTHRSIDGVKGEWRVTLSFYKSMLRDDNCVHGRIYPLPRGVKRHPFVGKLHRVAKGRRDFGVLFSRANFPARLKKGTISAVNNMPIKWVLHWQPNAGTTANTQTLTEVSQCVGSINGTKKGKWRTTLNFYKPILKEQANASDFPQGFWGISLQEQPNKYYMVIKNKRLVTEAESSIQVIMEKLQSYETRVGLNFEGFQYELGDFRLRVGKVASIHSESLRGIVVEMEYLPISSWEISHQLMDEFFGIWNEALEKRSLPGHFVHFEPKFEEYGLSDQYTSQHTAVQYASTIAEMIAATESSQAVRN